MGRDDFSRGESGRGGGGEVALILSLCGGGVNLCLMREGMT